LGSQATNSVAPEPAATPDLKEAGQEAPAEPAPPTAQAETQSVRTPQTAEAGLPTTGTLKGKVPVAQKKPMATVKDYGAGPAFKVLPPDSPASAVWVGAGQPPVDPAKTQVLRVEQKGFQFRPGLLVVQTGTPVTFPNEDPLYHSVFSYSPIKRLDLGRFRQGEEPPSVVMDKPGMIQLFCEVHEHMRGTILVVDTPWFAVTDAEGNFEIPGLPTGKYPVKVWISAKEVLDKEVEILAGQVLEVNWQTP
jgi:plastocyanin